MLVSGFALGPGGMTCCASRRVGRISLATPRGSPESWAEGRRRRGLSAPLFRRWNRLHLARNSGEDRSGTQLAGAAEYPLQLSGDALTRKSS